VTPKEVSRSLEEKYGFIPSPGLIKYAELKKELAAINNRLSAAMAEKGIPMELAETLFAAMRCDKEGKSSPSEIARILDLPPTTISSRLKRMEELGWASREMDSLDRRSLFVRLLPLGIDMARTAWQIYSQVLDH
jgi:DNA-binding MarR family transcriptional regulator